MVTRKDYDSKPRKQRKSSGGECANCGHEQSAHRTVTETKVVNSPGKPPLTVTRKVTRCNGRMFCNCTGFVPVK